MERSRFIIGIDLGTTNCVVSYIDTSGTPSPARVDSAIVENTMAENTILDIPQVADMGVVESSGFLPAFIYLPPEAEDAQKHYKLPWPETPGYVAGKYAQKRGAQLPSNLISSAKSWLCHQGVDRTAPILPWNADGDIKKMSPLECSSAYLAHMKNAWNYVVAKGQSEHLMENQEVYVAVPASFDAVARDLTVKAAAEAGLTGITLLEEPLAAFYSWVNRTQEDWRKHVKVGDIILVCDIGGGTTDFSLIEVAEEDGQLSLKRIAVGEHILLGGDNMDLTLAYVLKKKFADKNINLDHYQLLGLIQSVREGKEKILNDRQYPAHPIVILGRGRSVIGGTIQTELLRGEVEQTLVEGFFPFCKPGSLPAPMRSSGFKELGLHYAADTAVTKHMAKFLVQHVKKAGAGAKSAENVENDITTFIHPTGILFNGGVTKASTLRRRILEVINDWLGQEGGAPVEQLHGNDPDLAVAIGAAYYGFTKRGKGIRVRAGAGRSYYIGVESSMPAVPGMLPPIKAVCVVPFGMEEGTDADIAGQEFGLVVGEQSTFRFLASTVRQSDQPGQVLEPWETDELTELAPFETTLTGDGDEGVLIPVKLHSFLTETGALELWCEETAGAGRWKLEFNIRDER